MVEREPLRVQERSNEALNRSKIPRDTTAQPSIRRVPHNRMADAAQVDADLMSPAGVDGHLLGALRGRSCRCPGAWDRDAGPAAGTA